MLRYCDIGCPYDTSEDCPDLPPGPCDLAEEEEPTQDEDDRWWDERRDSELGR